MKTSSLLYRTPSIGPIVTAFLCAIAIHLGAIALAERHETVAPPSLSDPPFIEGFEPDDPTPPPPPTLEISVEPPPPVDRDFVEEKSPPIATTRRFSPTPIHRSVISFARTPANSNARALATSVPRPDYPYEARRQHITGSGIVSMTVDPASGAVIDATIEQSIGSSILDDAALSALRRWRFKTGAPRRVRVPITFTLTGAQL